MRKSNGNILEKTIVRQKRGDIIELTTMWTYEGVITEVISVRQWL
jgi:hypothetical protein